MFSQFQTEIPLIGGEHDLPNQQIPSWEHENLFPLKENTCTIYTVSYIS